MAFAPDFGVLLRDRGMRKDAEWTFLPFHFLNLVRTDSGTYSTMANIPIDGTEYAASLDFDQQTFDQIISLFPPALAEPIRRQLAKAGEGLWVSQLPRPVPLRVTVRLGEAISNDAETFVPLVIKSVGLLGQHADTP